MKEAEIESYIEWECPYVKCKYINIIPDRDGCDVVGDEVECDKCHKKVRLIY